MFWQRKMLSPVTSLYKRPVMWYVDVSFNLASCWTNNQVAINLRHHKPSCDSTNGMFETCQHMEPNSCRTMFQYDPYYLEKGKGIFIRKLIKPCDLCHLTKGDTITKWGPIHGNQFFALAGIFHCNYSLKWKYVSIDLGNGLVPHRHQAIA